ncbi:hypothetical protein PIB30_073042 [Stylosanthes scabra]|uniref:Uncharacterized protein n=1 Tax=Stylosanthes scabra TaxID=79078 RepID=A0ABU6TNX3_9FABA|nr:hypothetical protein [Stylosanthes scabra]
MSQGSSPSLHQNKIMSRLAFTTHLSKRDIHGLKAAWERLPSSRTSHVWPMSLDMAKRDSLKPLKPKHHTRQGKLDKRSLRSKKQSFGAFLSRALRLGVELDA